MPDVWSKFTNENVAIWGGVAFVVIVIMVVAIYFGLKNDTCNTELTKYQAKLAELEIQQEECANTVNTITNDLHSTSQLLSSCTELKLNRSASTSSNICDCTGTGRSTGEEERRV
jgi:peptidoglycan hydrolase CwlO-like protein